MSQILRLGQHCGSRGLISSIFCSSHLFKLTACQACNATIKKGHVIAVGTVFQSFRRHMANGVAKSKLEVQMQKWKKRKRHHPNITSGKSAEELVQVLDTRLQQLRINANEDTIPSNSSVKVNNSFRDKQIISQLRPQTSAVCGYDVKLGKFQSPLEKGSAARNLDYQIPGVGKELSANSLQVETEEPFDKSSLLTGNKNPNIGNVTGENTLNKDLVKVRQQKKKGSEKVNVKKSKGSSSKKKVKVKDKSKTKMGTVEQVESEVSRITVPEQISVLCDADSDSVIAETGLDGNVLDELQTLLEDPAVRQSLSRDMKLYFKKTRKKVDKGSISHPAPFWIPSQLSTMADVKQALEDLKSANKNILEHRLKKIALLNVSKAKQEAFNAEIKAYVQACIDSNMLHQANFFVMGHNAKRKSHKKKPKHAYDITNRDIYVMLMKAWAKRKNLERIRQLFVQMEENGVSPPLEAFVAALECLGRQEYFSNEVASRVVNDIEKQGYDIRDIPTSCLLEVEEWTAVRKSISNVVPGYEPFPSKCTTSICDNPLLQPLYSSCKQGDIQQVENPHYGVLETEELWSRCSQQMALDVAGYTKVKSIQPVQINHPQVEKARCLLESAKENWRQVLLNAFEQDLVLEKKKSQSRGEHTLSMVPYLTLLSPQQYVDLMMQEIEHLSTEMDIHSPTVTFLYKTLGSKVYQLHTTEQRQKTGFTERVSEAMKDYLDDVNKSHLNFDNYRECWHHAVQKCSQGLGMDLPYSYWPPHIAKAIGKFLYRIILCDIKVDAHIFKGTDEKSETPAFYKVYRDDPEMHVAEVIKPHPLLVRLFREACLDELVFRSTDLPSLVPPMPWVTPRLGGGMLGLTDFIKNPAQCPQQVALMQTTPVEQLNPVFDSLNALSMTPWKINTEILDIITRVFNSGGDAILDVPPPASSGPEPPPFTADMNDWDRLQVIKERHKIKKMKAEMHSLWATELYRLSIANRYRDEIFWFPHNLDFRGRVYAVPPYFNHLGSDLARSLLLLGKGKPLGSDGLNWLKIHLVNLTGLKKRVANHERLAYANELMPEILDSADQPFTGKKWWKSSDEPWQTLACCMEIAKAVRSVDPATYVSHYPVHQDGSCNGLQHYAALGRDMAGAKSVNLAPCDIPNDVYTDVVELVEQERAKDAAAGNEVAIRLQGFVKRKVIKQTIMTTVYGVTKYGAKLQIQGQLEDIPTFPQERVFESALYLADKTFHCLQKMFTATKEIQDWLTVCANLTSTMSFQPVEWQTPLGLPVIQPYFSTVRLREKPPKEKQVVLVEKPNMRKQRNAFPPNFIHSLDSTHMMLTALHCLRSGITFISVHDCFWTHACDVNTMNKICREQFVALHNQPILEDLAAFMLQKYGFPEDKQNPDMSEIFDKVDPVTRNFINHVLTRVPERGEFPLEHVLDSTYFFS